MNLSTISGFFSRPGLGLLLLRIGAGAAMILHGLPKFSGGWEHLAQVGQAMSVYGVNSYFSAWGFAAALAEVAGGALVLLGLYSRLAALAVVLVLVTAVLSLSPALTLDWFTGNVHTWTMLCVFLSLFFTGSGSLSLDSYFAVHGGFFKKNSGAAGK